MIRSQSKLYRWLRTFSEAEWGRFEAFVASPYHCRSEKARALLALLRPWFPVTDEAAAAEALDKTRLFAALFPGQPYRDSNISNLMTTLTGLIERFWAAEALERTPGWQDLMILSELRRRPGLHEDFERTWQRRCATPAEADTSPAGLFRALQLREERLAFQAEQQARSAETILPETLDLLRQFVLTLALKYYLAGLNRQRLATDNLDLSFVAGLWDYLSARPELAAAPPLRIYDRLLRCLQDPADPAAYAALQATFDTDRQSLAPAEARSLTYLLLNYLNGRLKAEGPSLLPELFRVYREAYTRGDLFDGPWLDANIYLNILNVVSGVIRSLPPGDRAELVAWRATFVQDNLPRLRPEQREDTYAYARAYLAYQAGDYAEAYRRLSQYKHQDTISDISRRMLLVRVYYDAWDTDLFDSQVKSALMYISRASAVAEGKRLAYNRFVRFTRRLFALRGQAGTNPELARVAAAIAKPEPLECRQWLLEKCAELSADNPPDEVA